MHHYRIATINAIAPEGLALFSANYSVSSEETDPQGIIVRSSPVDLNHYPHLLAVARAGAGVNNIQVDEATARGICVFNTPGANANAVVELVFTMFGIWLRKIPEALAFCQGLKGMSAEEISRLVEARKKAFKGEEMAGKTLVVIGLGKIGVRVASAAISHGMRVIGFDPFPVMENIHQLSHRVELASSRAEALSQADVVTVHVPLNNKTRGLIDDAFIGTMKEGALLFNYARGPVADEEAVLRGLDSGRLSGHISDFPSAAFLDNPKILLSPHLGASTAESEENCACMAVHELKAYLEYGAITHSVNFPNVEAIPTVWVHTRLIVINRDQPGMIARMTVILGRHGINIISFVNKSNGLVGYNIIDCENPVASEVLAEIEGEDGVIRTRAIVLCR